MNRDPLFPARYGSDLPRGRRIGRTLRWMIRGRDPEPTPAQWQAIGQALWRGDAVADDLVAAIRTPGSGADARTLRTQFEHALEHGIQAVPEAPPALRAFFAQAEARPAWLDDDLLARGTQACHLAGLLGMQVLRDAGLMAGYQASAINRTLVLTGALSGGAQRRLAETSKWWVDVTADGGMARFAPGFKSTLRVRFIHAMVRHRVSGLPEWDAATYGLPVNQADMLATYLGFSVVYLLAQRLVGVRLTREEGRAAMHLWKYIGWLMGVEEGLLLDDEMDGRAALYHLLISQAPPDESSRQLGRALMDEPLTRHYARWPTLQGRWERAKHLSICKYFLGREGMRNLGLPVNTLPWYPIVRLPFVALGYHAVRLVPGGRDWLARRGRLRQEGYLRVMFGHDQPDIGEQHAHHPT